MMEFSRHKNAIEAGTTFGFAAGLVLALVEMMGASAMGLGVAHPMRWAATILLGPGAIREDIPGFALFVFAFSVHSVLTVFHGIVFCLLARQRGFSRRASVGTLAGTGVLFGVWAWFFDFQILGQSAFPWMLSATQWPQFLAHTLFFGLPLGLFFAWSERYEIRAMQRDREARERLAQARAAAHTPP